MWTSQPTILRESQHQYHLLRDVDRLTFGDFIRALREDAGFRKFYNTLLADSPFEGIYWEHPPLSASILEQPYEMVLIAAPYFSRARPEPNAFRAHFVKGEPVVDFLNLGGDARLVVPTPQGAAGIYTHLASFVRRAPTAQRDAFWPNNRPPSWNCCRPA